MSQARRTGHFARSAKRGEEKKKLNFDKTFACYFQEK